MRTVLVFCTVLLTGCASAVVSGYGEGDRGIEATRADREISAAVTRAMVNDPVLSRAHLDVETEAGVVTLSGQVADHSQSARAESIARSVAGVHAVRNELVVGR